MTRRTWQPSRHWRASRVERSRLLHSDATRAARRGASAVQRELVVRAPCVEARVLFGGDVHMMRYMIVERTAVVVAAPDDGGDDDRAMIRDA